MRKTLLLVGVGLIAVAGFASRSAAAVVGRTTLSGHVPAVVSTLTATSPLDPATALHLAIGLPTRNQAGLDLLMSQITDPASPNYRQYLTTEQFTEQFGPTTNDLQAVINFANANGLTVTRTHANRMVVEITGAVSDVERAFGITLKNYQHPTESRLFFSPDTEPSVPMGLPVQDISGLSSYFQPHSFIKPSSKTAQSPAGKSFVGGSAPDGSFIGYDFRKAYVPGTTLTGTGQKIALVQFDGYFPSDIAAYEQLAGLPTLSITNILLDGFDGNPTMTGGEGEVELDIEMANSMAPGLSQLLVYEENPAFFRAVVVLSQIASDNAAKQVSCSWSLGAPSATINQLLQQMAVQGQSFFQSSGDSDAMLVGQPDSPNSGFAICANAYLTSVGGTKLTTDSAGNFVSESVWNDRTPNNGQGGDWGSGGGVSFIYGAPAWQQGFATTTNHGFATGRNFPDVAMPATEIYLISENGQAGASGGTSAAAPLWAGFMALVNQQAAISNRPPIGFLNPAIYNLARSANYTTVFNDVVLGDNTWPGSPTNYFAVPGYDLATGLGSPKGTNLINYLTLPVPPVVVVSAPRPPYGTTLATLNGGNPNGPWFLFVQDDSAINTGIISNGWFLNLTTANPVGYAADNQLYVTPASASIATNTFWTVSLAVTNYGPSSTTNVLVSDNLPPTGLTLVSSNATAGSVTISGSVLTWSVGNLSINTGAKLTLSFLANAIGTFTNDASVAATTSDPNPDDDNGIATLLVSSIITPPTLTPSYNPATHAFQLAVTGAAGQSAIVQASTNLVTGPWVPVATNLIPFTFTSYDSTNFPMRFYRTLVGP